MHEIVLWFNFLSFYLIWSSSEIEILVLIRRDIKPQYRRINFFCNCLSYVNHKYFETHWYFLIVSGEKAIFTWQNKTESASCPNSLKL